MGRKDADIESPVITGQARAVRPKAWAQLAGMYLQDLPHQLESMRLALESNDFTTIKQFSHRIKGTAGTYHLNSIFKSASAIELLANKRDADGVSNALEQIPTLIEQETGFCILHSRKGPLMDEPAALVLTIDDDPHLLALIGNKVSGWGYEHRGATDTVQMYQQLEKISPSVILLDIALGKTDGTTLLPQLKQQLPNVPVIMITAHATIETAVKSLKSGAYDFVCKPLDFDRLHIEIDKAVMQNRLSQQVRAFQSAARRTDFHGMIGRSEPMRKAYRLIEAVAPTDATVLLLGQTGTGKELAAWAIHECSNRRDGPFVAVNAPAIPNELIESALFGHEKGAFTGAHQQHIGYCEQADGGTLFLDEICEMNYEVQAKLLRFLQDHIVQRVGSKTTQKVNVRVIAATNRDPVEQISKHKLREDFYYRLSVVSINLSPLNQREGDVVLLARYFLDLAAAKYGKEMATFATDVPGLMENYCWPGNVRQLEHLIDQVVITNGGTELVSEMLPQELKKPVTAKPATVQIESGPAHAVLSIRKMEEQMILQALELASGSVRGAAKYLELSEATLYRKIKRLGIKRSFEKGL